jgi:AraC-like DNA-binding protein
MPSDHEHNYTPPSVADAYDQARASVEYSAAESADGYASAVKGIAVEGIQIGSGSGTNDVWTTQIGDTTATQSKIAFPMLNRTTVGDGDIAVVVITATPKEGRWCEIDLRPGSVLAYGPGADHAGIDPIGFGFTFAILPEHQLESLADEFERGSELPPRGQVHELAPSPETSELGRTLSALFEATPGHIVGPLRRQDEILQGAVLALSNGQRNRRVGSGRGIDNRQITKQCIEYAEALGRIPTITELCEASSVSERRMRTSFVEVYGMPPSRFFRLWALDAARSQLMNPDSHTDAVADVALVLGLNHLGRFARRYTEVYGESPSMTLRSALER